MVAMAVRSFNGGRKMKTLISSIVATLIFIAPAASAAEVAMRRVLSCVGPDANMDANMEVYLPETLLAGTGVKNAKLDKQVTGAYSLDLSEAGKGKMLEPVHVRYSADRKAVIVEQYTRKLPPTAIAVAGATVDFDQRFGTSAKCGPFNQE
jgi:hypothetical protein